MASISFPWGSPGFDGDTCIVSCTFVVSRILHLDASHIHGVDVDPLQGELKHTRLQPTQLQQG